MMNLEPNDVILKPIRYRLTSYEAFRLEHAPGRESYDPICVCGEEGFCCCCDEHFFIDRFKFSDIPIYQHSDITKNSPPALPYDIFAYDYLAERGINYLDWLSREDIFNFLSYYINNAATLNSTNIMEDGYSRTDQRRRRMLIDFGVPSQDSDWYKHITMVCGNFGVPPLVTSVLDADYNSGISNDVRVSIGALALKLAMQIKMLLREWRGIEFEEVWKIPLFRTNFSQFVNSHTGYKCDLCGAYIKSNARTWCTYCDHESQLLAEVPLYYTVNVSTLDQNHDANHDHTNASSDN